MADITNPSTAAKSYADFGALGELRGKAQRNEKGALRESAEQFEALFIQMMLKSMREANNVLKSDMFQSNALETFQGMYDKELSLSMAKRNALGFADVVVKQLSQQESAPSTAELLALRQKNSCLASPRHAAAQTSAAHEFDACGTTGNALATPDLEAIADAQNHAFGTDEE